MTTNISYDALPFNKRYIAFDSIAHKIQFTTMHNAIKQYDEKLKEMDATLDITIDYTRHKLKYTFTFSPGTPITLKKDILIAKKMAE